MGKKKFFSFHFFPLLSHLVPYYLLFLPLSPPFENTGGECTPTFIDPFIILQIMVAVGCPTLIQTRRIWFEGVNQGK